MSFGQLLVWLNYRYFIAIMIFFVIFGAAGALFYRLLVTMYEEPVAFEQEYPEDEKATAAEDDKLAAEINSASPSTNDAVNNETSVLKDILFWVDWLPVRIVAFGYMLVGHFSKAMPVWLENLFDV